MRSPVPEAGRVSWALAAHAVVRIASGTSSVLAGLVLASDSGAVVAAVGALGAVAYAAELLAAIPFGVISDRQSSRPVMAGGAIAACVAMLLATTGKLPALFAARLIEGLAAAAIVPALLAYLTATTAGRPVLRVRAMSGFELTLLAGFATGGIAAANLFAHLGAGAFAVVAIAYAIVALAFAFTITGEARRVAESPLASLRRVLSLEGFRRVAPVWLCVNTVTGLWLGPTVPFLLTHPSRVAQTLPGMYARAPQDIGWLLFGYAVLFSCGVVAWSVVLPRIELNVAMTVSLAAMLVASALIYELNHADRLSPELRWVVAGATALAILVESGFTPAALTWVARTLPPDSGRGAAMGVYSVLLGLGGIAGSILAGILGQAAAIDGLLLGTAVAALVAIVLVQRLFARNLLGTGGSL